MRSVMRHEFSRTPAGNVPRSRFDRSHAHKTTFDADYLIPVLVDEALPGDIFRLRISALCRLATPLFPIMDNAYIDLHCWSVPWRLIWTNFKKFLGEQTDPGDSIDYTLPVLGTSGSAVGLHDLADYMGLPLGLTPSVASNIVSLPFRAYRFIYDQHYRDQNLIDSVTFPVDDGPDSAAEVGWESAPLKRGKKFDYFTQALPWPQKGDAVDLPLGTNAPIYSTSTPGGLADQIIKDGLASSTEMYLNAASTNLRAGSAVVGTETLFADLSSAAGATINQLRQSLAIQQFLELAARAGTRFAEIIQGFFGVEFQDVRYRPEYLGGGTFPVNITPIANTSDTTSYEQGELAGFGLAAGSGVGFTKAFDEWCYVIVLASVRCDLTYSQGVDRMWTRSTRYDLYWRQFAHIGEQALLRDEIYHDVTGTGNSDVFGYVPRYDEYRWKRSLITGQFRSDAAGSLEAWHWSQDFASAPTLNQTFIENAAPIDRTIATPTEPHFISDFYFDYKCVRPMPVHGIPGMTRL